MIEPTIPSTLANALFANCCRRSDIPEQCMPACDYDRYNSQLVSSLILERSECPPMALPTIHLCASRGQDHRECCARAGVPSQCTHYCAPFPRERVMLGGARFPCLIYLEQMKGAPQFIIIF
ncbi:DB module [Ancylostoma duodenale]|uniref:DB module n=1 Tax=Ancylostoma duodenale TaxID=51022 RepID=A0A0C2GPA1_9BILA|nr:DB module [Ancylostoma duodenale]